MVVSAAITAGAIVALVAELDQLAIAVLQAFLAGAVLLNILKEELPAERRSRFWPFALSATAYGVLLLFI